MQIVFHGENAAAFYPGFAGLVDSSATLCLVTDALDTPADRERYANADVIVGIRFDETLPTPKNLSLFLVPGAGYNMVKLELLPPQTVVCNCFGHEQAIAEYVMAALLSRFVPLADADARLRKGDWRYWASTRETIHEEMGGRTLGLLGFGHIAKAIAARAKPFNLRVHVANRSVVPPSGLVDQYFPLGDLSGFWPSADFIVASLPLTNETTGIVGAKAFAAMRPNAIVLNVGRGPLIDQQALFDALSSRRIGGAIIDTWYQYPSPGKKDVLPSTLPFHTLDNIVMTPHMSGWTNGTIERRQQTMAGNIRKKFAGEPCVNVVREGQGKA
jgi:phosphoglycerate dehydrogenase-like enzyme